MAKLDIKGCPSVAEYEARQSFFLLLSALCQKETKDFQRSEC